MKGRHFANRCEGWQRVIRMVSVIRVNNATGRGEDNIFLANIALFPLTLLMMMMKTVTPTDTV